MTSDHLLSIFNKDGGGTAPMEDWRFEKENQRTVTYLPLLFVQIQFWFFLLYLHLSNNVFPDKKSNER